MSYLGGMPARQLEEPVEGWTPVRSWIPSGHLGIEWTVRAMRRIVLEALASPLLAATARNIVGRSRSSSEAAERIRIFLENGVWFAFDPAGVELVKPPDMMLEEIEQLGQAVGDCDDVAALGAALGRAIGLPARFVLLAFTRGAPYEHVFTELLTDGGWLELDTTRPNQLPSGLEIVRTSTREV